MRRGPGLLACRAVHQYRRRDPFVHTALRHHLAARAAASDGWAERVDTELVRTRGSGHYLHVDSFKQLDGHGQPVFRPLHLPGPAEVMAETALLRACAEAGGPFRNPANVFSYRLAGRRDGNGGVFAHYWPGYERRLDAIRKACGPGRGKWVVCLDVRRFYPSIPVAAAEAAWRDAAGRSSLETRWFELGLKLLADHHACDGCLLTGPMFSHLIGNLVLRPLDEAMAVDAPGGYFRYVDDVALVGTPTEVARWEQQVTTQLSELGLELHPDKRLAGEASDWLATTEPEPEAPGAANWGFWVGNLRHAMLWYPETRERLTGLLQEAGIRVQPLAYAEVSQDGPWLGRMLKHTERKWFRSLVRAKARPAALLGVAERLRTQYTRLFHERRVGVEHLTGFAAKQRHQQLRLLGGRLVYLADPDHLQPVAEALEGFPEHAVVREILRTLSSGRVDGLLPFGPLAAQAAVLPLRSMVSPPDCSLRGEQWQRRGVAAAAATLHLGGVQLVHRGDPPPRCPLMRLAEWGNDSLGLRRSGDGFEREFACLHPADDPDANRRVNEEAFDRDDRLAFFASRAMEGSL